MGLAAAAPPALAGWSRPQRAAGPYSLDVLAPSPAFSAKGEAALGFTVQNEDHQATSQAVEAVRSRSGKLGHPHRVPASQEMLDLAYNGSDLSLLVGTSLAGTACCSTARLVKVSRGAPRGARTILTGLTGPAVGRLLPLPGGRMLSAIATEEGLWVEQAARSGRPAPAHLLTPTVSAPQTLAATLTSPTHTMVAWTDAASQPAPAPPPGIVVAEGSVQRPPGRPRVAVTVAPGHQIDEVALGRSGNGATAAWIENWYDSAGALHSQAAVADLGRRVHVRAFAIGSLLASNLSLATARNGAQVLAWKVCDRAGSCGVEVTTRDAGKRFGKPLRLARIDPSQAPAAAISQHGQAMVGWIDRGRVLAATRARGAARFTRAAVVSSTTEAADLTLGFGAAETAVAAWTQGVFPESVMSAASKGP